MCVFEFCFFLRVRDEGPVNGAPCCRQIRKTGPNFAISASPFDEYIMKLVIKLGWSNLNKSIIWSEHYGVVR